MSTFQLGLVTTVFALGRLVADLPGGHFADRVRAINLMALSAGGVALGSLLLGLSWVALVVYVASFLLGICSATTNATGMTFFSTVSGASHRGTSMAIFSAALLGGQAIGPATAGLIASIGGWRVAMFVGAAAAGIVVLVLLMARSNRPPPRDGRPGRAIQVLLTRGADPYCRSLVLQSVSFAVFLTLGSVSQTMVPIIGADDLGPGHRSHRARPGRRRAGAVRGDARGRAVVRPTLEKVRARAGSVHPGLRCRASHASAHCGRMDRRHRRHVAGQLRRPCCGHDPGGYHRPGSGRNAFGPFSIRRGSRLDHRTAGCDGPVRWIRQSRWLFCSWPASW